MGSESGFLPANENNPTGYYEDSNFVFLNDAIIEKAGGTVWNPPSRNQVNNIIANPNLSARLQYLLQQREREEPWGWKDPRNCITVHAYLEHCNPGIIVCNRDPVLIAESMMLFNEGLEHKEAFNLATEYYERIIGAIRSEDLPYLIMHHELTLMDPQAAVSELMKFARVESHPDLIQDAIEFVVPPCR